MTCPDDEDLARFASAGFDGPRVHITAHLDTCESCRAIVGAFARQSAFIARVARASTATAEHPPAELSSVGPGSRLGRYVIVRGLDQGAMGRVFVGYDGDLDRHVAIKILVGTPGRGLRAEAAALARLSHPNVVTVYEIVEEPPFIAMEYVDGLNFAEWMAARARSEPDVIAALLAVAEGLAAVHERGLVHRDVKPENVLIGRDGRVRLGDFGLATIAPVAAGEVAGTPAYMAPEQRAGAEVDSRADQVGFATMAWEALTGQRPDAADARAPDRRFAPILRRALAADRSERFASMTALVDALRSATRPRRRRWPWLAAATLLIGAGVAVGATTLRDEDDPCRLAGDDTGWDARASAALQRRFDENPRIFATTAGSVRSAIDAYARDWRDARVRACRDRRADPARGDRVAAVTRCLDERRVELAAAVGVLGGGDREVLLRAWDVVAGLRPPSSCELGAPDVPAAALAQREVTSAQLARARALERAGALVTATTVATAIASDASGDDLATEHALLLARLADGRGARDDARGALDRAALAAERSDQRSLRASVLAARLQHEVTRTDNLAAASLAAILLEGVEQRLGAGDDPDGRQAVLRALAAYRGLTGEYDRADAYLQTAERLALSPWTRAQVAQARCTSLRQAGKLEAALSRCRASVDQLRALVGADHPALAAARVNEAVALAATGQRDLGIANLEQAIEALESMLGAAHITTVTAKRNLASMLIAIERRAEAGVLLEAVLVAYETSFGGQSSKVAALLVDMADNDHSLGKLDRAAELTARATTTLRALYPGGHPDLAMSLLHEAELALERGKPAEADRLATGALAMFEQTLGPTHERLVHVLYFFAELARHRGEHVKRRTALRRALALDHLATDVELALATELAGALEPRTAERIQLVDRALGLLAKVGDDPAQRAELEKLRR